jgi:hypothetical protein
LFLPLGCEANTETHFVLTLGCEANTETHFVSGPACGMDDHRWALRGPLAGQFALQVLKECFGKWFALTFIDAKTQVQMHVNKIGGGYFS